MEIIKSVGDDGGEPLSKGLTHNHKRNKIASIDRSHKLAAGSIAVARNAVAFGNHMKPKYTW